MELQQIRETHKKMHGNKKVLKEVIKERLEMGWSIEDTINKDNGKTGRYRPYRIEKRKDVIFV